jgi:hypothetical protein
MLVTAAAVSPNDPAILTPKTHEEATELVGELVGVVKPQSAERRDASRSDRAVA